ncbi:MAG: alpha/beta hydrolase [Rhodospirillales bacterium]|nr:MAG: alpha/beta hydrolase [Rhodospirillales bacterium]
MQQVETDDGEIIHVAVGGSGPPIVLLHEWASNHRVWKPAARALEPRFTVYRWDARGHGGHTPQGREPPTVGRMAEDLHRMLDHFGLDRVLLAGHSMGALVAWEYIARHGCGRLAGLGIIDQSPQLVTDATWRLGIYYDWPRERDAAFVADLRRDFVETVVRLVGESRSAAARARYTDPADGLWRLRAFMAAADPAPLITVWQSLTAADWRPVLPRITVPVLLVYGSDSNFYGAETGEFVRDAVPDGRLLVYPGADHSPHLAEPERFAADLAAFADSLAWPARPAAGR